MQDLYFWVSFPSFLGIVNSDLPPKLLSSKTSIERIEKHIASTRTHLDNVASKSELTDSELDSIEMTMCSLAVLITTRRQELVRSAMICIQKELKNLIDRLSSQTAFSEISQKHIPLCNLLKTKSNDGLSRVISSKDRQLLQNLSKLSEDYLSLLNTRTENIVSCSSRPKRNEDTLQDYKLLKKLENVK